MKIMVMPNNIDSLNNIISKIDAVLVGIKDLSVNCPSYYTYQEFLKVYELCKNNNKEIFVSLNKNMHNKDLDCLKNTMFMLDKLDIQGIVYYDIAVVNIKLENDLKCNLVWGQEHMTTNYITSNFWYKHGSKYTLVSGEITIEEILEMKTQGLSKLIVPIFGYLPMFVSERHLVKNYIKTFNLTDDSKVNYIEKEGNIYPIIDDLNGTRAYSSHILNGIKEIPNLEENKIDYVMLNQFLIDDEDFAFVIGLVNDVSTKNKEEYSKIIDDKFNTDYGFLYQETIYKVKKND